jgi:hypothetical protein
MTDAEIKAAADRAIAYLLTPDGQQELRESNARCEAACEALRKAAKVPWELLHVPFDI